MKTRFRRGQITLNQALERTPVRIVADGGIATVGVGEGQMVPLVILDTTERPDLEAYIQLHHFVPSGDVDCQWAMLEDRKDTVALILRFLNPAEVVAIVEFDLARFQGVLVEQILTARSLYIQAGREGDRLKHDVNRPKVLLEVPDMGFRAYWDKAYLEFARRRACAEGLGRPAARRAAASFVEQMQAIAKTRLRGDNERPSEMAGDESRLAT